MNHRTIGEHKSCPIKIKCGQEPSPIYFQGHTGKQCVSTRKITDFEYHIESSYYIGIDWLNQTESIYVAPKLNDGTVQIDFLGMLFSCLQHPEIIEHTKALVDIKFNSPAIEIEQRQDMLSPLLMIQFLQVLHSIIKKGLKKSYYKIESNLNSRVKGKLIISTTIKHNIVKNKQLYNYCSYDEFGLNCVENRLLKKTLLFVHHYVTTSMKDILKNSNELNTGVHKILKYCIGAMHEVDETIELHEIKVHKTNAFYKEYAEGIRLSKLILKRFGYNIDTINNQTRVKTPPFWIDMSKLFELYVLGLLKERYANDVQYHFRKNNNELDYLVNTVNEKIIVDAKYRPLYNNSYDIEDIRQLSGYARLKNVLFELGYKSKTDQEFAVVDCLIVYPMMSAELHLPTILISNETEIKEFNRFYKVGIGLPLVSNK